MIEASNERRPDTHTPDLIDLSYDGEIHSVRKLRDVMRAPAAGPEPRIIVRLPPACSYQALVPETATRPSRKTPSRQTLVTGVLDLEGLLARYRQ